MIDDTRPCTGSGARQCGRCMRLDVASASVDLGVTIATWIRPHEVGRREQCPAFVQRPARPIHRQES